MGGSAGREASPYDPGRGEAREAREGQGEEEHDDSLDMSTHSLSSPTSFPGQDETLIGASKLFGTRSFRRRRAREGSQAGSGKASQLLRGLLRRRVGSASSAADDDVEAPLLPADGENSHPAAPSEAHEPRRVIFAPLTDMPSKDPSHGPKFKYETSNLLRIVYEGKGVRKISRYRERKIVNFGWMHWTIWKATSLASGFCWLQIMLLWLTALLVGVFVYLFLFRANSQTLKSLENGLSISGEVRTLAAFILGYYMEKTINIWWTLRHDTLQQLMNVIDNMCLRMAIYFPGNSADDKEARETIMRYGILSLALLFKDAQEVDVWSDKEAENVRSQDLSDLVEEGLITQNEVRLLQNVPAKSQMCWVWISSLFTKWCLDGRLPDPLGNQNTMLQYSEEARNAISTILAQLNMQFPLSYSHLIIFFSKIYMVILAIEAGVTFGAAFHHSNYADVISKAFILTVAPILYQGLLEIKEHISNPFRDDITDYSFKMFHARLRNECTAFFDCAMEPPYTTSDQPYPAVLPPQFIERQVNTAMYDFDVV